MSSVDFTAWAVPNLDLALHGHAYSFPPPSVGQGAIIIAMVTLNEISIGLAEGPADPDVIALSGTAGPSLPILTLGQAGYDAMVADGADADTIERIGFYALHYWARGKRQADGLATLLWDVTAKKAADAAPKAPRRRRTGKPSASANRTRTATTPTTASPKA